MLRGERIPQFYDIEITDVSTVAGIRGSGKSNNTWNFIKEKIEENIPICIISPSGEYRGLPGFYEYHMAEIDPVKTAMAIRKTNVSTVIETKNRVLTKGMAVAGKKNLTLMEKVAWLNSFCESLMDDRHINPLVVIVEECHEYIPQKRGNKAIALLTLAKESRKYGIGILFITQAIAEMDKDAFRQSTHLLIHRLKRKIDLKYVSEEVSAWDWEKEDVYEYIPSLEDGEYFHFSDYGVDKVTESPLAEDKPFGHTPKFDKVTVDRESFEKDQNKQAFWKTLKNPWVQILIWTLVTIGIVVTIYIYWHIKIKGFWKKSISK